MASSSMWVAEALRWTEGMRAQQFDTQHHDVGFKVFGSFGQALQLAAGTSVEPELARRGYTDVVVTAAHSLATRFSPVVGCTQSWAAGHHCKAEPEYMTRFPVSERLMWSQKSLVGRPKGIRSAPSKDGRRGRSFGPWLRCFRSRQSLTHGTESQRMPQE